MKLSIIVAVDQKSGIGKDGKLAWYNRSDLQFFRSITIGRGKNAVIMGRKTYQSIPAKYRPLPHRLNIVLSRGSQLKPEPESDTVTESEPDADTESKSKPDTKPKIKQFTSLNSALAWLAEPSRRAELDQIFIIGGSQLYQLVWQEYQPMINKIYYTVMNQTYDCDSFFPALDIDQEEVTKVEKSKRYVRYHIIRSTLKTKY